MHRNRLGQFLIGRNQINDDFILWNGASIYGRVIQRAFPQRFKTPFEERYRGFDYGMYAACRLTEEIESQIQALLNCLQSVYLITGINIECYAAGLYTDTNGRTTIGELIYHSKHQGVYTSNHIHPLATYLLRIISAHPSLRRADLVLPMPSSPDSHNRLPEALATRVSNVSGIALGDRVVTKRSTSPMKDIDSLASKRSNIHGAFSVPDPERVAGKTILLIDDTIGSGETLREIGDTLRKAGAARVLGLSCAKNLADR